MIQILDRGKKQKLYVQLYEIIKEKIESDEWPVGSQIPTEEDLCKTYDVSKAPVRVAIQELVHNGYLMRQQGKGTFVCKRVIPQGLTMHTSFKELMLDAGVSLETVVLAKTVMMSTEDLEIVLNIPENTHLAYIKRLRVIDNEPIAVQVAYVPHKMCPGLLEEDYTTNSLIELLESKYGFKITVVKDLIEVGRASAEEGKLLNIPGNSPVLLLEQYFYSGETLILYMRSIKKPERFKLFMEFERKG